MSVKYLLAIIARHVTILGRSFQYKLLFKLNNSTDLDRDLSSEHHSEYSMISYSYQQTFEMVNFAYLIPLSQNIFGRQTECLVVEGGGGRPPLPPPTHELIKSKTYINKTAIKFLTIYILQTYCI